MNKLVIQVAGFKPVTLSLTDIGIVFPEILPEVILAFFTFQLNRFVNKEVSNSPWPVAT